MHNNANLAYLKNESEKILNMVLELQPRESSTKDGGADPEAQIKELVAELREAVP